MRTMTRIHATPIEASRTLLARGQLDNALTVLAGLDAPQFRLARLVVLRAMGAYAPAMEEARAVLRVHPGHAQATTYLAMLHLLMGYTDGWQMYRARWNTPGWPDTMPYPKAHLWDGQLKPGTSVLFWAEQGFGDTIQFARYLPWLYREGLQPQLQCPSPLKALFAQAFPQIPMWQPQPGSTSAFDAHLPLLDLPCVLPGFTPDFCNQPYLQMPATLAGAGGVTDHNAVRVGIVWAGRPTHPDDAQRSVPVSQLEPLWSVPGVTWINLQQGAHPAPPHLEGERVFGNFLETARCIADLDLVITVDTAVAHLAGAMGKTVWVLLPFVPDWRWGLETPYTPWYPRMSLYRQLHRGDWSGILRALTKDLARFSPSATTELPRAGTAPQ